MRSARTLEFARHPEVEGQHSWLSPSTYHWVNYDDEKFDITFLNKMSAAKGTRLHGLAKMLIDEGVKLPANGTTLSRFVNDAIGYRMTAEQVLFYSYNAFGTADAILFKMMSTRRGLLRIHDLKNGDTRSSMMQLRCYAALFCLEYDIKPGEIDMEFRIYQNDDFTVEMGDPEEIIHIMDRYVVFDKRIEAIKEEVF